MIKTHPLTWEESVTRQMERRGDSLHGIGAVTEIPLSDADWEQVKHLFPEHDRPGSRGRGRPRRHPRKILDAILWVWQTGEKWHRLPATFPPTQTCYVAYSAWRRDGIVQRAVEILGIIRQGTAASDRPAD